MNTACMQRSADSLELEVRTVDVRPEAAIGVVTVVTNTSFAVVLKSTAEELTIPAVGALLSTMGCEWTLSTTVQSF